MIGTSWFRSRSATERQPRRRSRSSSPSRLVGPEVLEQRLVLATCNPNALCLSDEALVSHFEFNEGSGSVAADSAPFGIADSAVLENGAKFRASGIWGGSADFDGFNDIIRVEDTIDINLSVQNQYTIAIWFKVDNKDISSQKQVLYQQGDADRGMNIYLHAGRLYVGAWNVPESGWTGSFLSTSDVSDNRWHHVVAVLDADVGSTTIQNNVLRAYIDGIGFGQGAGSQLWADTGDIGIGAVSDETRFHDVGVASGFNGVNGDIEDLRIYRRALSAQEANSLAQIAPAPLDELTVSLDFEERLGNLVVDAGPFGVGTEARMRGNADIVGAGAPTGQFVQLDGSGDFITIADSPDINQGVRSQHTVSMWFRASNKNSASRQVIYEQGGQNRGLNIYIQSGELIVGGWNIQETGWNGTFFSTSDFVSNQWHHVALVLHSISGQSSVEANTFEAYLDGSQFGSGDGSNLYSDADNTGLGAVQQSTRFREGVFGGLNEFAGGVADLRVYDKALTNVEVGLLAGRQITIGTLSLAQAQYEVIEGSSNVRVRLIRTGGSDAFVTLDYTTIDGSATAGQDFANRTATAVFATGETVKVITVPILDDSLPEPTESIGFGIDKVRGGATLGEPRSANILIHDDELPSGNGTGLTGEYYNNYDLTGPVLTRVDSAINFDWGSSSPQSSIAPNTFSIRWRGSVLSRYTERYTFRLTADDGARLWVDGQLVINRWNDRGAGTHAGRINLTQGQQHDIIMEYRERSGRARINLEWSSASQPRETIPQSQLFSIVPLETGLVGHWRFDQLSGLTANDATGMSDGVLRRMTGTEWTNAGRVGGSLDFDGHNDFVRVVDHAGLDLRTQLTLTSFVKLDRLKLRDAIISKGSTRSPFRLQQGSRGRIRFSANTSNPVGASGSGFWDSNASLLPGQWHHVAVTYDGRTLTFYIDGVLDKQVTTGIVLGTTNEPLTIGADLIGVDEYLDGELDDTRIYDRALSSGEVSQIARIDPGDFVGRPVVSGLFQPTAIDFASDGRMFIAQKNGVVKVHQGGQLLAANFIDISQQVNDVRDRGLLDLAVHPDFPNTPYVYLLFTYDPPETLSFTGLAGPDGRGNRVSRLIRVTADAAQSFNRALPNSEVVLLGTNSTWANISSPEIDSTNNPEIAPSCGPGGTVRDCLPIDSQSHTIGSLKFGVDGALYVTNGDGASYGHVDVRAIRVQNLNSLSGKLLRIDPINGRGLSDNPFYNNAPNSNRAKVYSYGLRNPFRMAIHPVTGEPFVGDVGWTQWEEINTGRGANFGWPYYEGSAEQPLPTGGYSDLPEAETFYASGASTEPPIWSRAHADGARAVALGDFYTGNQYPDVYDNALFISDFGEPTVRALVFASDGSIEQVRTVHPGLGITIEMTDAPDGHMYYVDILGTVGRLEFEARITGGSGGSSGAAVIQSGNSVTVVGTAEDDTIVVDLNSPFSLIINGNAQTLPVGIGSIIVDGRNGSDSVSIIGTNANETVVLRPGVLNLESSAASVSAVSFETIYANGGAGFDQVTFTDSEGNDRLTAEPGFANLAGVGFDLTAEDFDRVIAKNIAGGSDTATLSDSASDDTLRLTPTFARLEGGGFYLQVLRFGRVIVNANAGGDDTAMIFDSSGSDTITSSTSSVHIVGNGFNNRARLFETTTSTGTRQSNDTVIINGTAGQDTVTANQGMLTFSQSVFEHLFSDFDYVAFNGRGGNDLINVTALDFVFELI